MNRGKFARLKAGDFIKIIPEKVLFKVVGKKRCPDFKTMIKTEGLAKVIPDKKTLKDAVKVYYQFYTPADEKKNGVVAIRVKKIKN